jgi:hypothetical protein
MLPTKFEVICMVKLVAEVAEIVAAKPTTKIAAKLSANLAVRLVARVVVKVVAKVVAKFHDKPICRLPRILSRLFLKFCK